VLRMRRLEELGEGKGFMLTELGRNMPLILAGNALVTRALVSTV